MKIHGFCEMSEDNNAENSCAKTIEVNRLLTQLAYRPADNDLEDDQIFDSHMANVSNTSLQLEKLNEY